MDVVPAGTTIEAVYTLEKNNFRGSVISAMESCSEKAIKMGKKQYFAKKVYTLFIICLQKIESCTLKQNYGRLSWSKVNLKQKGDFIK